MARRHFSEPICAKEERNAPHSTDQGISAEVSMLITPFECTQPPPLVLPFLLVQNLSPKDISRSDITS